jgi:hypothetical protein
MFGFQNKQEKGKERDIPMPIKGKQIGRETRCSISISKTSYGAKKTYLQGSKVANIYLAYS